MINVSVFVVGLIIFLIVGGFSDGVIVGLRGIVAVAILGVYLKICQTGHGIASSGVPILN